MPGAHKIGAAISGPGIAGGNFMDITLFLNNDHARGWASSADYAVVFLLRPPKFTTPWTLLREEKMSVIPRKMVSAQGAPR